MHKRGYIYWAELDKRRPVLVLSPDIRNSRASDIIIVPISSVLRQGPWHVRLNKGECGVRTVSIIKCEQITTLSKDSLGNVPLGDNLSFSKMKLVERAVLRAIGIPIMDS
jgi:mRNA-degrading endonuclease toxin of MazEF toxin-antitoxin module